MKTNKTLSIALAVLFSSSIAIANEVSGKLVLENAGLNSGGMLKNEMKIKLYVDGDITDNATYHAELQGSSDSEGNAYTDDGDSSNEFTQNADLRELYADISGGDWDARIGKQQIVWGTADGMKLLDIINPTDYAEMAQDQTVWALNLERGSVQAVISQPKENVFAGLNRGTDTGIRENGAIPTTGMLAANTANVGTDQDNAFRMMGPETITGAENGFLNIVPDLGSVAGGFGTAFMPMGTDPTIQGGLGNPQMSGLLSAFTVNAFTSGATLNELSGQFVQMQQGMAGYYEALALGYDIDSTSAELNANGTDAAAIGAAMQDAQTMGFRDLNFASMIVGFGCQGGDTNACAAVMSGDPADTQNYFDGMAAGMTGIQALNGFGDQYDANLSSFGDGVADSAFEYMGNTGFRTFDTFVNARSQYVYNMPKSDEVDFAIKTSQTTKSGVNYSLNFSNSYDKNPIINLRWKNDANETLTQTPVVAPSLMLGADPDTGALISYADMVAGGFATDTTNGMYLQLTDSGADNISGTTDDVVYGGATGQSAILEFEQAVVRTKNIGGSFDTSFQSAALGPVVIRGEALYTMDGMQPVMSISKLSVGDLVGALSMKTADRLKFVLGVDVTVLTNMLISSQYISDRNLDFLDTDGVEYTTDYATMHLSNGFNKAIENKQYGSLFLSKPFGESGQHRWNNITMLEQGTGEDAYWNRFDVSWGLSDDVEGTFELNNYWGNENTQFGQLKDASNKQVGLKYSF